jgi:uncharacterized protein YceH (UPF0502 family)
MGELTAPEQRVLGCLIEKRWTTPDQYPLSLNALRLACNQSTNRDPVTNYDEPTVREAANRLTRYGLARLASGHGSRATKTPGELKSRAERMADLGSLEEVDRVLVVLIERGHARRMARRPGQKEDRFEHLLGAQDSDDAVPAPASTLVPEPAFANGGLEARVSALEAEVAELREQLARLAG